MYDADEVDYQKPFPLSGWSESPHADILIHKRNMLLHFFEK